MLKLLSAVTMLCASAAFAADAAAKPATTPAAPAAGQAAMFTPHKAKNVDKDKKEILALLAANEENWKKNDMASLAQNFDFPVLMVTDNAKNEGIGEAWDKDRWMKEMSMSMENMPKDVKMSHKEHVEILTDAIALVLCDMSMTAAGKTTTWKSSNLAIRKDGKWMWKSMMEGGWGDMPPAHTGTGASGAAGTMPTK